MNEDRLLLRTVDLSSLAVKNAARKPENVQAQHHCGAQAEKGAKQPPIRYKRGDHQRVHGQPSRAGHKGRDQNRGNAVALVLDGARRHDGRHGAGVRGKQRNETLALQAEARHGAVRDQRGPGQIAGILQDSDKQKQNQDLRQKHDHAADAVKNSVDHQRVQGRVGNQGTDPCS